MLCIPCTSPPQSHQVPYPLLILYETLTATAILCGYYCSIYFFGSKQQTQIHILAQFYYQTSEFGVLFSCLRNHTHEIHAHESSKLGNDTPPL